MVLRSANLFILLSVLGWAGPAQAVKLEITSDDRLLLLVPHPDDEVLCCGGLLQQAVEVHIPIKIVIFTYGDYNAWSFTRYHYFPVFRPKTMRAMGELRRNETLKAAHLLGVPAEAFLFLGYPDFGMLRIWNAHWDSAPVYESRMTQVQEVPYPTAHRPGTPYKGDEILHDLKSILKEFRPTKVFVPHPADRQADHRALSLFTQIALWDLPRDLLPDVYAYLIHSTGWPSPRGLYKDLALEAPASFSTPPDSWRTFPLTEFQVTKKGDALRIFRTQWAYSHRFLTSHVRTNELFDSAFRYPDQPNPSDFEEWHVTVDSQELVLVGRLSQQQKVSSRVDLSIYGYRNDIAFEQMPKLSLSFRRGQCTVMDRSRPVQDSGVRLQQENRAFTVRIPRKILGQPRKIFVSAAIKRKRDPFVWSFWQIHDLENEAR
jgi:LmbE family N-acetylglucosaminyl deacetylase